VERRGIRTVAILGTLVLTLAACSDDTGDTGGGDTGTPEETGAPAEATVAVEDSDLGQIVVDGVDGTTLYVFLADETTESTCYEECEDSWPPLTVEGDPVAGEGVDQALLGTTERTDGSVQVTLDGHPLYYFSGDEGPDDTNGQDVGDVWYVVSPDGAAIEG
jgi:predicted lipoprotein with Yx(FWY)xxD motif